MSPGRYGLPTRPATSPQSPCRAAAHARIRPPSSEAPCGTFGTSAVLPSVPGLPGGIPGLPGQTPPYLEAGNYTVDNGPGGSDIGHFSASLALKTPLTWVNQDAITAVDRSQGVTVTWSG